MDNHYHRVFQTPQGGLSRAMRHLDGIYTQRFNRAHHRDGPLLRGRYKAILIDTEEHFFSVVRYIHQNPVLDPKTQVMGPGGSKGLRRLIFRRP